MIHHIFYNMSDFSYVLSIFDDYMYCPGADYYFADHPEKLLKYITEDYIEGLEYEIRKFYPDQDKDWDHVEYAWFSEDGEEIDYDEVDPDSHMIRIEGEWEVGMSEGRDHYFFCFPCIRFYTSDNNCPLCGNPVKTCDDFVSVYD